MKMGMFLSENLNKGMGIARQHLYYKCETGNKCRGRYIASLREGGGPRSGGRSLRNFEFSLASLSRPLPQSAALTAPSRREASFVHSSAYINKVPTNLLIGLWELFVDVFSPLRTTEKMTSFFISSYTTEYFIAFGSINNGICGG